MGFFSWNCKGCSESIKAPYGIPKPIEWQNNCVSITPPSNVNRGEYDGYGRINGIDICYDVAELWHEKCWEEAGSPMEFTESSVHAEDQGYFYDYNEEEEDGS